MTDVQLSLVQETDYLQTSWVSISQSNWRQRWYWKSSFLFKVSIPPRGAGQPGHLHDLQRVQQALQVLIQPHQAGRPDIPTTGRRSGQMSSFHLHSHSKKIKLESNSGKCSFCHSENKVGRNKNAILFNFCRFLKSKYHETYIQWRSSLNLLFIHRSLLLWRQQENKSVILGGRNPPNLNNKKCSDYL